MNRPASRLHTRLGGGDAGRKNNNRIVSNSDTKTTVKSPQSTYTRDWVIKYGKHYAQTQSFILKNGEVMKNPYYK
jgi:hypothetical protein